MELLVLAVLLIATAFSPLHADVKHVLDGSAQPPQHVHTYDCQPPQIPLVPGYPAGYQAAPSNAVPGSAAFWWADSNSPFKHAYEYFKKCSEKGNCPPAVGPPPNPICNPGCVPDPAYIAPVKPIPSFSQVKPMDFSKNPFLNGEIPALPTKEDRPDFSKNPFLNGNIGGVSKPSPPPNSLSPEPSSKPDFSKNPFLNGNFGQTAFSGNGQAIQTGTNGFLGVQPTIPFGKINGNGKPSPNSGPTQIFQPTANDNQIQTTGSPGISATQPCNGPDDTCVTPELCTNGVVNTDGAGILDRRQSGDYCESGKVCCRVPFGTTASATRISSTRFASSGTSTSATFPSKSSAANSHPNVNDIKTATFPSRSSTTNSLPNLNDIKNGKNSAPGSVIKFAGGAGNSPGSIQVISDNEAVPNPQVSHAGESGHGLVSSATSEAPVFASTPDYSRDDLSRVSFVSTIQGPQYLPPDASPKPIDEVPELIAPSISTYEPSIPTTPKPFTRPVLPGISVVSVHTQPTFIPSPPQPFIPVEPISYPPPPPVEILPEEPSSPQPFVPLPSVSIIPFPSPPLIPEEPIILPSPPPFIRPEPEVIHIQQPSTPLVSFENRYKPSEPPRIPFIPKETPGYKYPTPTPPFSYPSPSTPKPSFSINDNFIPIKTKPSPKPKPQPTPGYEYKKPTPIFTFPTAKPFNPQPQPSGEYEIKTRFPSFPTPPAIIPVTNRDYLPPIETPKPYNPQPLPSDEYEDRRTPPSIPIPPPTIRVTNNQYLPPFETQQPNRIPEGSNANEQFALKPTVVTPAPYNPIHEGQPDVPIPDIIGLPRPQQPSPPQAGCAAALKCVQEIYCTASGVISPVPVILSKGQQLTRVPTTECTDREAGIVGRCCRDPNYVDPWPSANSINGFDDGQYREDPNLGKYFPQNQQRLQRSESRVNGVKGGIRTRSNALVASESVQSSTCGVRHFNSQPRSPGPIDVTFGEIPWQAMILRDSTRKLLCGGVIVKSNAVLTSAQCLDGLPTSDILIKGGEWKLGIDEEPLPFQIVKVAAIIRHPLYKQGVLQNDLALLMLEEHLRTARNIAPICLGSGVQPQQQQCIVTGWGKRILQVHLKGAIMRAIDVNILDSKKCEDIIQERYQDSLPKYFTNTICGFSRNDQCDVDYGSALACTNGDGVYSLAGIFSWDTGCKDDAQIGGYIPPDAEWIENTCTKPFNQLKALDRKYNSQYQNS